MKASRVRQREHKITRLASTNPSRVDILEDIIDLIVAGSIPIGVKTSEAEIAQLFGFESRTPIVREALALLVRDGIIDARSKAGYWVQPVTIDEARQLLQLRTSLELTMVEELAAEEDNTRFNRLERILDDLETEVNNLDAIVDLYTEDAIVKVEFAPLGTTPKRTASKIGDWSGKEQLQTLYQQLLSSSPNGGAVFLKLDAHFHIELARVAGFLTGVQAIRSWTDKLRIFQVGVPLSYEQMKANVLAHRAVLEFLKEHNGEGAKAIITEQFQRALKELEQMEKATSSPNDKALGALSTNATILAIEPAPACTNTVGFKVWDGKERLRRFYQGLVASNLHIEQHVLHERGGIITWITSLWNDNVRQRGLPIKISSTAIIQGSKVWSLSSMITAPVPKQLSEIPELHELVGTGIGS